MMTEDRSRQRRRPMLAAGTYDLPRFCDPFAEGSEDRQDVPVSALSAVACRELRREVYAMAEDYRRDVRRLQDAIDARLTALENEPLPLQVAV